MKNSAAVVTGMGCLCAAGSQPEHLVALQKNSIIPKLVPDYLFPTKLHNPAFILPEQVLSFKTRKMIADFQPGINLDMLSRTTLLCLEAVLSAVENAGLTLEDLANYRVGIAIGTTVGCTFNDENFYYKWRDENCNDIGPMMRYLSNNLADAIQLVLKLKGPAAVINNACASGTDALGLAKLWVDNGLCDIAIAGGADELSRIAYHGFAGLMSLSEERCRPFDLERKGLNLGEGSGILILEQENHCSKRGACPLAGILGYAAASDGHHPTAPHPEGKGLMTALKRVFIDSEVPAQKISYINGHGTGTKANDAAEAAALSKIDFPSHCKVVSTKAITGHMLGAAGAMEAIITICTLNQGHCSGTVGCLELSPEIHCGILLEKETANLNNKMGISQSLAFGGANSVLLLEGLI